MPKRIKSRGLGRSSTKATDKRRARQTNECRKREKHNERVAGQKGCQSEEVREQEWAPREPMRSKRENEDNGDVEQERHCAGKRPRTDESLVVEQVNDLDVDLGTMDFVIQPNSLVRNIITHHENYQRSIGEDKFDYNIYENNALLQEAVKFFKEVEDLVWERCTNCSESWIMQQLDKNGHCHLCHGKKRKEMFAAENNLTPSVAPKVLTRLSPIEKSAISIICPSIGVYKKGTSTATRGHCISFFQNVVELAKELPRLPKDLPFVILKNPREANVEKTFKVNRAHLLEALVWLRENNEDYANIPISRENLSQYPEDGILKDICQLDPQALRIPEEEPSANNEESARQEASTVMIPPGGNTVLENLKAALGQLETSSQSELSSAPAVQWPTRDKKAASEFIEGYYSKAFPDLFPDGRGDITKARQGKNPSKKEYFKHLMRVSRAFSAHHSFTFVATNILRRHQAITHGNVFAKRCADGLSMAELKKLTVEGDQRILNKLLYFSSAIPGTTQNLRAKADQAISLVRFVRIHSEDKKMFTWFQTFSAADLHWNDLHRLLPGSEKYLHKTVVDSEVYQNLTEEEKQGYITQSQDYLLRVKAINDNADFVDFYFYIRLKLFLKHVLKVYKVQDYIIRYEVQARGTIHAHLLFQLENGPSHTDLDNVLIEGVKNLTEQRQMEIKASAQKIIRHSCYYLGISALHPNPDPIYWPGPYGQDVHTPSHNILRQRFLDITDAVDFKMRHERLLNRCMCHKCRVGYCLDPRKRNSEGNMTCRFGYPIPLFGFKTSYDENGTTMLRPPRHSEQAPEGADYEDNTLTYIRNHPTVVHHIPEILATWGANIEGRTVKNYNQVIKYLLKYMMKPEPNSKPFSALMKAVVQESANDGEPRKAFMKMLMMSVQEHDFSKQECSHMLNGLDFVEFSRDFAPVNAMGTRKIRLPEGGEKDAQDMTESNIPTQYWNRESNEHYQKALADYKRGNRPDNPESVSLYYYAMLYNRKWNLTGKKKVPHVTPSFSTIPTKNTKDNDDKKAVERYLMFLRSILLAHKPGTTFRDVNALGDAALECEVRDLCSHDTCPKLVKYDFKESQKVLGKKDRGANANDYDEEYEGERDPEAWNDDQLYIPPQVPRENLEQELWMETMRFLQPDQNEQDRAYDEIDENNFGDERVYLDQEHDWQEDSRTLSLSEKDKKDLCNWLDRLKASVDIGYRDGDELGGLPENLNDKQRMAFDIVKQFVDKADEQGLEKTDQLLLNISGAAGTGKSFWLNTIKRYARSKENLAKDFVRAAAPSGTAAFLIGGETLHSLLLLPVGKNEIKPLSPVRLGKFQQEFANVGLLVIDEKSMIGLKLLFMINARLKEARPQDVDKPFGGISIVLLGDWKQLPPVLDGPLYHDPSKDGKKAKHCEMTAPAHNLYLQFNKTVVFEKIQRQDGDDQKEFREELERLSKGQFTLPDWKKWRSRSFELLPPEQQAIFERDAVLACAYKKDMLYHNRSRVEANQQPIALIKAENIPRTEAGRDAADNLSGLQKQIIVCRGTKIRLTRNLWTSAGLTNGAEGTVRYIIYGENTQPPDLPMAILANFPAYRGPGFDGVAGSVPICPVKRKFFSNRVECSRQMLPVILGYALSIHKLQGSTLEKVILNPGPKEFALGLLLVGATRVKTFQGLAFRPMPNYDRFDQIRRAKQLSERLKEEERLQEKQQETLCAMALEAIAKPVQDPSALVVPASGTPQQQYDPEQPKQLHLHSTGLQNLGNTCYMNSVLQCLTSGETFASFFLDEQHQAFFVEDTVAYDYAALVKELKRHQAYAIPKELKATVGRRNARFQGIRQEDAQEFLLTFLDILHQELLVYGQQISFISQEFQVEQRTVVECLRCHRHTVTEEQHKMLRLALPEYEAPCSLQSCVEAHFSEEEMATYRCDECNVATGARKWITITHLPPCLIIQLVRYKHDGLQASKQNNPVDFELTEYFPCHHGNLQYTLRSVVDHHGDTLDSGHYTAKCSSSDGHWKLYNDDKVSSIDPPEVKARRKCYMLFYNRQ